MTDPDEVHSSSSPANSSISFVNPKAFHSGFVTLVGRPNAGKSTLINAVMEKKIAITSNTAQTTRHRFRAVYDTPEMQMVLVDTPGLHKPHDALGEMLNDSALKALSGVDVVAMLIDCSQPVGFGDRCVAAQVQESDAKKMLIISKADLGRKQDDVKRQLERALKLADFDDAIVLSAKKGFNVGAFTDAVYNLLPCGPRWFAQGSDIDQPREVLVAEFIREKILRTTYDEVPHSVGVVCEHMTSDPKSAIMRICAVIYVEHDSQKGIIIGKAGHGIKRIGTDARRDLERLFDCRIHLDLTVKVKKNWRQDATLVRKFGYGEGL